jgi:malonyl-CoA O-methyltransferase
MLKRLLKRELKTLASVDAYALWAQNYRAEAHNTLMNIEQRAMQALMPILTNKVVLDLACGTGRYGKLAHTQNAKRVIGLDNSHAMLRSAQIEIESVAEATTEHLPLPSNSVDVVLCGLALGHLPSLNNSIQEIGRILKPKGIALISDFHPFQYLSGARRTFMGSDGNHYAVEHYAHLYSNYHTAFTQAQLAIIAISEPRYQDKPVVIVYRVEKFAND